MKAQQENETESIIEALGYYISGAIAGNSETMKPAFHKGATVYGYIGEELFAGPIQMLFDWNDENGPASELEVDIADIDIAGTVATARVELRNWTGNRFTDLFTLLKTEGEWKIINKVFHLHV